jgi:hypothetical protein
VAWQRNEIPWLRRGLESLEIAKKAGVKIGFGSDLLGPLHRYQSREFAIRAEIFSSWDVPASKLVYEKNPD